MKSFSILISLILSNQVFASTPTMKRVPITGVFSPRGYDIEDNSELVVSGYLPNSCHRSPTLSKKIVDDKIEIVLTSFYYGDQNPYCTEVIMPFVKTIPLGKLDQGNYDVVVNEGSPSESEAQFIVSAPRTDNDRNEVYANVEYIERDVDKRMITLKGHNPSDCYTLDKIRVIDNGKNTISILPRMKKVYELCAMKMTPFSYEVQLPPLDPQEENLIHVRSMNGDSINTIL